MANLGKVRYITIHASATPPSMEVTADDIDQWHRQRGFDGIGYHKVIRRDGVLEPGRPLAELGAHVGGHNTGNIGICMAGGVREDDRETPENNFTDEQWMTLFRVMKHFKSLFPDAIIMGHNGFPGHESRGCPCFDWIAWRKDFNRRMHIKEVEMPSHWYEEVDAIKG